MKKMKCLEKKVFNVDSLKKFVKNNLILKTEQKFNSESHNIFTKVTNKIALSSNYDKRMQSIDSIEAYAYGTRKDIIVTKEEIKERHKIMSQKKA